MNIKKRGFTLVEMMMVVGIVGALSVLGMISFAQTRETSYAQKRTANCRTVDAAKDHYLIDNNLADTNAPDFTFAILSNYLKVAQDDLEDVGGKKLNYGTGTTPASYR